MNDPIIFITWRDWLALAGIIIGALVLGGIAVYCRTRWF
jgi:hypothetical protein